MVETSKTRREFYQFLKESGFTVFPSKINAVLTKFLSEKEARKFVDYLRENDIIVSHGNGNSNIGLDLSYVRFAIGTPEEMDMALKLKYVGVLATAYGGVDKSFILIYNIVTNLPCASASCVQGFLMENLVLYSRCGKKSFYYYRW